MKTLMQRLEDLLSIDDNDSKELVVYKLRIYEWLVLLCDIMEEDLNKKDIN